MGAVVGAILGAWEGHDLASVSGLWLVLLLGAVGAFIALFCGWYIPGVRLRWGLIGTAIGAGVGAIPWLLQIAFQASGATQTQGCLAIASLGALLGAAAGAIEGGHSEENK